jgi:hypothetical protein
MCIANGCEEVRWEGDGQGSQGSFDGELWHLYYGKAQYLVYLMSESYRQAWVDYQACWLNRSCVSMRVVVTHACLCAGGQDRSAVLLHDAEVNAIRASCRNCVSCTKMYSLPW